MPDQSQTTEPHHIYSPTGWQPIETAPRDGRWFLAFGTHSRNLSTQMVIRWDGDRWQSSDDGFAPYLTPIHWMPLPEPPANTTEAAIKAALETAIAQWVGDQIAAGNPGFEFWDECDTSAALAEHLVQLWWPR